MSTADNRDNGTRGCSTAVMTAASASMHCVVLHAPLARLPRKVRMAVLAVSSLHRFSLALRFRVILNHTHGDQLRRGSPAPETAVGHAACFTLLWVLGSPAV